MNNYTGAAEYFKDKPYLLILLVVLAALAVFAVIKAAAASSKRYGKNREIMEKLKADAELRREFEPLTPEKARSAEPEKLVGGVALGLCARIEKAADMTAEFESFTEEQKELYALHFVLEDGAEKLSGFFKMNGSPLTDYAKKAVERLYDGEAVTAFCREFSAYDERDEVTSLIPAEVEKNDEIFKRFTESSDLYSPAAEFILDNIGAFMN